MVDRIVSSTLWLLVIGMIVFTAGSGLYLIYTSVLQLSVGQVPAGTLRAAMAVGSGAAAWLLCRHCNDLMDR